MLNCDGDIHIDANADVKCEESIKTPPHLPQVNTNPPTHAVVDPGPWA